MEEKKDNLDLNEELPLSEETVTEEAEVVSEEAAEVTEIEVQEETAEVTEVEVSEEAEASVEVTEEKNEAVPEVSVPEVVETKEEPKKKKGTVKKIFKAFGILLFVAFLALSGFVGYKVWDYLQVYVYTTRHTSPATFESETLSLTIDQIEIIDEIIGFEPDENYVYIGVKSTITNKTDAPLEWKSFPLLMVREYVRDEEDTGYVLVENTDQAYEMSALRNYAINLELDMRPAKDNLEAGASRTTADIFKILLTDYEAKNYFLTTDIFNEIVNLPELPAPEVETDADTAE